MSKKTLLVDLDGVLNMYCGNFKPGVLEPPLAGARRAMHILSRDFTLVCFTTRAAKERENVERWLKGHGFPHMKVTDTKDAAFLTLDDRAICFNGRWTDSLIEQIRGFKPWWQTNDEETPSHPTGPA